MSDAGSLPVLAAASIAIAHTLLGPDHYLPFVAMGRAHRWSTGRTMAVTLLCGVGHVLGSVALGCIGLAIGGALGELVALEEMRASGAAWLMFSFGLVQLVWGVRLAVRARPHVHEHHHADGTVHSHTHAHGDEHLHPHPSSSPATPWLLFVIFFLGPCEPLIPLLMYPAATSGLWAAAAVCAVFAFATLATMGLAVLTALYLQDRLALPRLARFEPAVLGLVVTTCGGVMLLGG